MKGPGWPQRGVLVRRLHGDQHQPASQRFYPMFQIVTEDLKVFDTDIGISPLVFETIREQHKVTHKYLVHPTQAIGCCFPGRTMRASRSRFGAIST